jgi:hypothetical protein
MSRQSLKQKDGVAALIAKSLHAAAPFKLLLSFVIPTGAAASAAQWRDLHFAGRCVPQPARATSLLIAHR